VADYDNNMRGIVSKNKDKKTDKHPDIKGQCEIDGVEYWMDGWLKQRKDGTGSFYSLSFKPKDAPAASRPDPRKSQPEPGAFDDDIPF
jgi:hypothetical protein